MPQNLHPDPELLLGFIDSPADPRYRQLGLHLANCPRCRMQAEQFQTLACCLPNIPASLLHNDRILSQHEVTAVTNGMLTATDISNLKRDPGKLKAALHLAANASVIHPVGSTKNSATTLKPWLFTPLITGLSSLVDRLKTQPPQWSTVVLSAVFAAGLTLAVNFIDRENGSTIVAYQDNPVIVFKHINAAGPGLGFFSDITSETAVFPAMDIRQQGNDQLLFRWNAVNDAQRYRLRLYQIQNGLPQMIRETSTAQTWLQLDSIPLQPGVRYEWQLSGETISQKTFKTAGGFIIPAE